MQALRQKSGDTAPRIRMPATKVPLRIEIDFFGCGAVGKQEYAARKIWIPFSPFRILADMFHFWGFRPVGQLIVPSSNMLML